MRIASKPSMATVKRLYAVSGNRCAFPGCNNSLVDKPSGKLVGRICHIKAAKPGGPRFDENQSDEERHGFENLVAMCPIHHDVIDADPKSYSVERLHEIKAKHEAENTREEELSDELAIQFLTNISSPTITNGSVIISNNQMGGQIAHAITNLGPSKRGFSEEAIRGLAADLAKFPSHPFEVEVVDGNPEARALAFQFLEAMNTGGWTNTTFASSLFPMQITGVEISAPADTEEVRILKTAAENAGLAPRFKVLPQLSYVHILIGHHG